MAKKAKKVELPGGEVDLTPMIDCVFLLIIFFMVCVDLKQVDLIKLKLPDADSAISEEDAKFIINVSRAGDIYAGGKLRSEDDLKAFLKNKYDHLDQTREVEPATDKDKRRFAAVMIKIRADELTEFRDVQKVLAACIDAKFYKTSFAAIGPEQRQKP
jgi:biopolymer transport protein ExbD